MTARIAIIALIIAGLAPLLTDSPEPQVRPIPITKHPYRPLETGAAWVYSHTRTAGLTGRKQVATIAERVTATHRAADGVSTRITSQRVDNQATSTHWQRVNATGLLPDVGPLSTPAGPVRVIASQGVALPLNPTRTGFWHYELTLDSPFQRSYIQSLNTVVGVTTVTVAAGVFRVVHVRQELHQYMHPKAPGFVPIDDHQVHNLYYARDVGLVLSEYQTPAGNHVRHELLWFAPGV